MYRCFCVCVCDLLSQQGLQDGQVSGILQGEDDDLAGVVKPRSSGHIELRAARWNEWTHRVTWNQEQTEMDQQEVMQPRRFILWFFHR